MFELQHLNDILVMKVSGELGFRNVRQFDSVLNLALRDDIGRVVLDFSSLAHIDYKLVPHLLERMIEIQCQGGQLKLAGMSEYVLNILKAMGFEEEMYPSVADAVISFAPVGQDKWQ
ncbi:MAG: STAS domain-containing protein [Deltaproteobacteria bacterium]|nr:STAS domain-containing protein [Deltaproteobacteria bacterium]